MPKESAKCQTTGKDDGGKCEKLERKRKGQRFYVAFNTLQVISLRGVGRAEETSTYSSLGFCTVNCRPMASNYQLSQLEAVPGIEPRPQRWEARVHL